nr:transposase [Yersinia frederiksenii]
MKYQYLCHTRWDCEYHEVYILKRRKQRLYRELRTDLGGSQRSVPDNLGKARFVIAQCMGARRTLPEKSWLRGYLVSTVGLGEAMIRNQEWEDVWYWDRS